MPYTLIRQINSQHAHFSFSSDFEGKTVTWDTNLFTSEAFRVENDAEDTDMKQFIEIEALQADIMKLTVVLKINEVNKPNILKMIIMIKQYKNLTVGRHEYG